jgi:nitrate/nitrite transporter NarK
VSRASFVERIRTADPQLKVFLAATASLGVTGGIFQTTINNYLSDTFAIQADTRGLLEFPREFPGFLVALFTGALFFLTETHVAAVAAGVLALGMVGLGLLGGSWSWMLLFLVAWSIGQHVEMPMRSAIAMSLGTSRQHGRRMGQATGARTGATVLGCLLVWIVIDYVGANYALTFLVGALTAAMGALLYLRVRPIQSTARRAKFVLKRRYWLYYLLCTLFGARKQVFITFAPWVLIKVFDKPASIFAKLWIVNAVLGTFFQPALGDLIDRWGERRLLMADGVALILICLGYGFAQRMGLGDMTVWVMYFCYLADQLLFGIENARSAYLAKIAERPEDVSPSLSMGISINHAVSMLVPALGGLIWVRHGYPWVFIGAAGIATLTTMAAGLVRTERAGEREPHELPTGD